MTVITINALGVSLVDPLFRDLSLTISKGDRIGLVAANGRGKSTLLSCLAGELDQTAGESTRARGAPVGFVKQAVPPEALDLSIHDWVMRALPADKADYESWRVDVVLGDLQVPYELQHRPLRRFSGGWQRTAMLASVWITEPDVLLQDEPTNHLDIEGQEALEAELINQDISCLLVSHDRSFLRNVGNRFWWIRNKKLEEVCDPEEYLSAEMGAG